MELTWFTAAGEEKGAVAEILGYVLAFVQGPNPWKHVPQPGHATGEDDLVVSSLKGLRVRYARRPSALENGPVENPHGY